MSTSHLPWQRLIGGLSGALSVAAGAYGSHGLPTKNQTYAKIFNTGVNYQLLHSALLLATPSICGGAKNSRTATVSGIFLTVGIVLFSGSCYLVGLTEDRKYGRMAPVGGFSMMGGWLSLALLRR